MSDAFMAIAVLLALAVTGCAPSGSPGDPAGRPRTLTVFAAASLTEPFTELAKAFEVAHPGTKVLLNLAGSQQLRAQLDHGARADIFASASRAEMQAAIDASLVTGGSERAFATNTLVVIVSRKYLDKVTALSDLARSGVKLVIADASVPAGRYTEELLDRLGRDSAFGPDFTRRVLANALSRELNVKFVVAKVRLGEVDAGVAYVSDVTPEAARDVAALPLPAGVSPVAEYVLAPLKRAGEPELAARFADMVCAVAGREVLAKHGFGTVGAGKP